MPHCLAGRILADEMRELLLKLGIAAHQRIIFGVGNLRIVLGMIAPVVMRNLPRQAH